MEIKIFQRLIEQRLSRGLNKGQMAALGGVAQPTYLRYESGDRSPDGDFWASIAKEGFDVIYILTGARSQPVAEMALLPEDERIMLDNYRNAPPAVQAGVKTTLGAFAPARGAKRKKAG